VRQPHRARVAKPRRARVLSAARGELAFHLAPGLAFVRQPREHPADLGKVREELEKTDNKIEVSWT